MAPFRRLLVGRGGDGDAAVARVAIGCCLFCGGVADAAWGHLSFGFGKGDALDVLALGQCGAALLLVVLGAACGYIDFGGAGGFGFGGGLLVGAPFIFGLKGL